MWGRAVWWKLMWFKVTYPYAEIFAFMNTLKFVRTLSFQMFRKLIGGRGWSGGGALSLQQQITPFFLWRYSQTQA